MSKSFDVVALGELLIDFTGSGKSAQGNSLFEACPGGAPKDAHVRVLSIDGVTLNCERIPIPAEQMK